MVARHLWCARMINLQFWAEPLNGSFAIETCYPKMNFDLMMEFAMSYNFVEHKNPPNFGHIIDWTSFRHSYSFFLFQYLILSFLC